MLKAPEQAFGYVFRKILGKDFLLQDYSSRSGSGIWSRLGVSVSPASALVLFLVPDFVADSVFVRVYNLWYVYFLDAHRWKGWGWLPTLSPNRRANFSRKGIVRRFGFRALLAGRACFL